MLSLMMKLEEEMREGGVARHEARGEKEREGCYLELLLICEHHRER